MGAETKEPPSPDELLHQTLAVAPVVLFWLSPAGIITWAEGHALTTGGVSATSLIGQSAFDIFPGK